MNGYTVTLNGQPIKISKAEDFITPEEYKNMEVTSEDKAAGSLTIDFEPGPLYASKARTGHPKRVEVLPWQ